MRDVLQILSEIRPECDFAAVDDFVAAGMLDSFDMVVLISELDRNFGISIEGTDIVPENFCSIAAIDRLLAKYGVSK